MSACVFAHTHAAGGLGLSIQAAVDGEPHEQELFPQGITFRLD